jgi:hypothetical protein
MAFPFGHGLSYTSFDFGQPTLSSDRIDGIGEVTLTVELTNVGDRPGSQVVQCYVAPPVADHPAAPPRPPLTLQGLAKVELGPGESATATITLGARAFARWHDPDPDWDRTVVAKRASLRMFEVPEIDPRSGWVVDAGSYQVVVATSSIDEVSRLTIDVPKTVHLDI